METSNVSYFFHKLGSTVMLTLKSYTEEQMNAVVVAHREAKTMSDKIALIMVKILRTGLDIASGYKHDKAVAMGSKDPAKANQKYGMTERKYMIRNIFLESVAGVPGMVAGMCRHLTSMRLMRRYVFNHSYTMF
jgi:ubiquinol oxidase